MSTHFVGGQHRLCAGLPRIPQWQSRAAPAAAPERLFRQPDPGQGRRGGPRRLLGVGGTAPRCRATLYQKGMRVLVAGRTGRDEWEDANENERVTFKVEARRVGILPCRVEAVTLNVKPTGGQSSLFSTTAEGGSSNRQTTAPVVLSHGDSFTAIHRVPPALPTRISGPAACSDRHTAAATVPPTIANLYPCRPVFLLPVSSGAAMLSPI